MHRRDDNWIQYGVEAHMIQKTGDAFFKNFRAGVPFGKKFRARILGTQTKFDLEFLKKQFSN